MAEHTPTPWAIAEVKTSCGRCFKIGSDEMLNESGKPTYVCVYDDHGFGDNAQRANANFIVKAVNNHDALVTALEEIAKGQGAFSRDPLTHASNTIDDMKALAREALAKVESA